VYHWFVATDTRLRGVEMAISYNKLWKLLIDKNMNKKDLRLKAGVSTAVIAKMGKGENLTTDVLIKVCHALDCDICDIMELEKLSTNDN